MSRTAATATGFVAVLMWALLALLTSASGEVPPFQLSAMTFAIAAAIGSVRWLVRPSSFKALRQPASVWLLGVGGLFGYHLAYFTALRHAPAIEASLIAYLWPLLLVLFSGLLPGERLGMRHLAGAVLGFSGAVLIVTKGGSVSFEADYAFGYAMALVCALTWSSYSVISRRFERVPTDIVTGFCLVTALLSGTAHLLFEQTVWPASTGQWLAVAGLGLGPVGLAFYAWDVGVKRGDIALLGVSSYFAPLLSTIVLIAAGMGAFSWSVAAACLCITLGAFVAAFGGWSGSRSGSKHAKAPQVSSSRRRAT